MAKPETPAWRLLVLCMIRVDKRSIDWSLIAREAQRDPTLTDIWSGRIHERSKEADRSLPVLAAGLQSIDELDRRVTEQLEAAEKVGARLVTVLDDEYPVNLRMIPNLPPFLFIRGTITSADTRSVAVVGTREASEQGLRKAALMSRLLVERGITIVSGLARGIDTAAHRAAIEAGGRTIAVLGTGIAARMYPAENAALAEEIVEHGAVVSQFWPTRSGGRDTFPRRNVVTSGISQGTVVVEASSTSGAKMQARLALEHGKRVFLLQSLVTSQPWAQGYVEKRGAIEAPDVETVARYIAEPERIENAVAQQQQLALLD